MRVMNACDECVWWMRVINACGCLVVFVLSLPCALAAHRCCSGSHGKPAEPCSTSWSAAHHVRDTWAIHYIPLGSAASHQCTWAPYWGWANVWRDHAFQHWAPRFNATLHVRSQFVSLEHRCVRYFVSFDTLLRCVLSILDWCIVLKITCGVNSQNLHHIS